MINIKPIKIKLVEKKIHLKLYHVIQLFKLNTLIVNMLSRKF